MKTYTKANLEEYNQNDWILKMIQENMVQEEEIIRTNKWLQEMDNKRMIYADVYGDILLNKKEARVLDVGGGYTAITKVIAKNCKYTLLDFMAHGGDDYLKLAAQGYKIQWVQKDWYDVDMEEYDIIIANDIFPDVDQRLELFLDKMLKHCKELRLVLTYYNKPKFYTTKRTDDLEIMTFLSWDGEITGLKLKKYLDRINHTVESELDNMKNIQSSIFHNGRQVSYITLKGDLNCGVERT